MREHAASRTGGELPEQFQSREKGDRRRDIVRRVCAAEEDWWVVGVEEELGRVVAVVNVVEKGNGIGGGPTP